MSDSVTPVATSPAFTLYTTTWCGQCFMTKEWLKNTKGWTAGNGYTEINIEEHPEAVAVIETINNGMRSVPTLVFPDGSTLTEPTPAELAAKLLP